MESFEERVKRLFGSNLQSKLSVAGEELSSSTWTVADKVERHRWLPDDDFDGDRPDRTDAPCSTAFYGPDGCLVRRRKKKPFLDDVDDSEGASDDGEDENGKMEGRDLERDEEQEIRFSIGLDPTLDNEEEEDRFDEEAMGKDSRLGRMYMNEVLKCDNYLNFHNVIQEESEDEDKKNLVSRDVLADHSAEVTRPQKDSVSVTEAYHPFTQPQRQSDENTNLKPILKRKESEASARLRKRVRFNAGVEEKQITSSQDLDDSVPQYGENICMLPSAGRVVPDYLKNPSKYTCYTLDTVDHNEETNMKAFNELFDMIRKSKNKEMEPDMPVDPPLSVTFTPRIKLMDAMAVDDTPRVPNPASLCHISIAADDSHKPDVCEMEEEDVGKAFVAEIGAETKKALRRYRSKISDDST